MRRRALLAALPFAQSIAGVRAAVPETEREVAAGRAVSGKCPIPSCATLTSRVVRDVKRPANGERQYVLLPCERCGNAFCVPWK